MRALVLLFALGFTVGQAFGDEDRLSSLTRFGFPAFQSANYAGYLELVDNRSAYYWSVTSESNPGVDPVLFWFNGGPGCSSLLGLFTEIGPFIFVNGGAWGRNPYTWATNMTLVFIESPGGVGFSPDQATPTLWNDTYVAQLNYAAVRAWFTKYPTFYGRKFFVAGESYAGHYVPQLVNEIVGGPDAVLRRSLRGFMAGNPCTGSYDGTDLDLCFVDDDPTFDLFVRTHALSSYSPAVVENADSSNSADAPYDIYDDLVRTCPHGQADALRKRTSARRLHDGAGDAAEIYGPCSEDHLTDFLNQAGICAAINALCDIVWSSCANVNYPTPINQTHGVLPLYRRFMETTDLDILVYSGSSDTVVNFIQTQRILLSLGRPLMSNFTPWYYQDMREPSWSQIGGYYLEWDRLSWASVRGAGHMVPTYQPAAAKQLLASFVSTGKPGLTPTLNTTFSPAFEHRSIGPVPAFLARVTSVKAPSRAISIVFGCGAAAFVTGIVLGLMRLPMPRSDRVHADVS